MRLRPKDLANFSLEMNPVYPTNLAIFTICSNNYMPMARVLLDSARTHHPDAKLYLCLADKVLPDREFYPLDCEIIAAEDLNVADFPQFAFRYDVLEFNTALKPFVFLHLLKHSHDAVLYFDPDIEIFAPLDQMMQKLAAGASFVLTPHLAQPAEGNSEPDDLAIMRAGTYNLGFCGVRGSEETQCALAWWARRLVYQCISDQMNGLFVDQKFMDLMPGFVDNVSVIRDTSCNVAYWNLTQRTLHQEEGRWFVDGKRLSFFHFSGFDCMDNSRLSKYTRTFSENNIPTPLQSLMRHYAERVLANGYLDAKDLTYSYGHFSSGVQIPYESRQIFRSDYEGWSGNPFTQFDTYVPRLKQPLKSIAELQVEWMLASTSWRLTKPLRMVVEWLKATSNSQSLRPLTLGPASWLQRLNRWLQSKDGQL